ncbi:MAG TPA: peptidase M48 [Chitinophagaceae bacterium]|nr:peptidase M48 [Chitinophagaceae bacterium]
MKRFFIGALGIAALVIACSKNPITGRSQLALVKEGEIQTLAADQYKQFLATNKVIPTSSGNKDAIMVARVGNKLVQAINKYYTEQGLSKELEGYQWEINLVDSKDVNAWCMPGGKIVVYTGILPVTQNEAALAVVMGHEIAHALAKHGAERMSQGLIQQTGGVVLAAALNSKPAETQQLFMQAYGVGSNVGFMLPFSRKNELEADKFGLMFSSLAGYDPREAIPFWERMAKLGGGQKPPELLSTHPADATRIEQLQAIMPVTLEKYYRPLANK